MDTRELVRNPGRAGLVVLALLFCLGIYVYARRSNSGPPPGNGHPAQDTAELEKRAQALEEQNARLQADLQKAQTRPAAPLGSAQIIEVGEWFDVEDGETGESGIEVAAEYEVKGLENIECQVSAIFSHESGKPLQARRPRFASPDGVSATRRFTCKNAIYKSRARLFVPYDELTRGLRYGKSYALRYRIVIRRINDGSRMLALSEFRSFTLIP